jgi:hypothetical protein
MGIRVFDVVADSIENGLNQAQKQFHKIALDALEVQVALGNNVYSTTVDGRPVSGKEMVHTATKRIQFNFPLRTIELAIEIMKQALQTEIGLRAIDTGNMRSSVRMWYGGNGKPPREVTGTSEIKDFEIGDYVMLVPDIFYYPFSNSYVKKKTGKGFMARTSIRIRRALRLTKKTAGLSIAVGRSRAVASHMNVPEAKGEKKKGTFPGTAIAGVPVIYLRWKTNQYRLLGA